MQRYIQAGKFKAECLRIMEEVNKSGYELIITKRHEPIAKLCPIEASDTSLFGKMKGTVHVKGDITQPIDEAWDADS
ncbi:MAG: type II toxin-antitoxin system prevent-host-death family antitoxin [Verrucomicrobia bacterium]|nr:type II toxin-antitoxin system prevent-host-death family antitoxin [Verrucomicrobiota bacterium]MBS0637038.1 type II toxin-antitoxin system prevent-host-death family antitoxin [Verrucomicrobiota bacterium]